MWMLRMYIKQYKEILKRDIDRKASELFSIHSKELFEKTFNSLSRQKKILDELSTYDDNKLMYEYLENKLREVLGKDIKDNYIEDLQDILYSAKSCNCVDRIKRILLSR